MRLDPNKTVLYDGLTDLPPLVERTVALSREMSFIASCAPPQGRLLQVLAAGREGGSIGETGTGCGVGLAWMVSTTSPATKFVSVEIDDERARACQAVFKDHANVEVLHGDWRQIMSCAPFDLAVLDGGGGGKRKKDIPPNPKDLLVPGGTVVVDDLHPALDRWPPDRTLEEDEFGRNVDRSREFWLDHPDLLTTEFRVHPQVGTIVGTLRG